MHILIPDSWLREFLDTKATPKDVASYLSLCGPTVDRLHKSGKDFVYEIEVTTNRVDAMSVHGIAREAAAILPRFGYNAKLKKLNTKNIKHKENLDIKVVNKQKLSKRILAIKLENVKLGPSPKWLQERLIKVGQRPLINAIDITNYVMWEIGHPIHAFDYDKITTKKIVVREAKRGERLTTLDNKVHTLGGKEVVFDNGEGVIIDLPGIMGTANTVVTKNTKNILLWIEDIDATKIRLASMRLAIRSQAAVLNEKHVDSNLGLPTILKGVELFTKYTGAKIGSKLLDIYPNPQKTKSIKTNLDFINTRLGINLTKNEIASILHTLEFETKWKGPTLYATIPTFRTHDMNIKEDIVEEVARIYGYNNLPGKIMDGSIPEKPTNTPFVFENHLKKAISSLGGYEAYTLSLVPKDQVSKNALVLKNPLGPDTKYLRTSLKPSLIEAAKTNSYTKNEFHIFEVSNTYHTKTNNLPEERMTLAGILTNTTYRKAKGVVETLLKKLNVTCQLFNKDSQGFLPSQRLEFVMNKKLIGEFGVLEEDNLLYYEFDVATLYKAYNPITTFKKLPKYPPQIEDITLVLPERTKVGNVIQSIKSSSKLISYVELTDIFKDSFTFRIHYQHPKKTLNDKEVESVRSSISRELNRNHFIKL
jgi:phenylalanyl-tRNA synthetase beta chain